jgi:predicted RNA-binding Zn ribbon-like protein
MSPPEPAFFIADSIGLDFLNSIATPVDVPVDWIADGAGLSSWLGQANLVPADVLDEFERAAIPGELDAVAAQARSLREWFRGILATKSGSIRSRFDLTMTEPLNKLLARDESYLQLTASGGGQLDMHRVRRWGSPESLLQPIAEALARVLVDEDHSLIRACDGHACTLLFMDRTKGHRRRWCSMAVCGNRAKQSAHYHRRRSGEGS